MERIPLILGAILVVIGIVVAGLIWSSSNRKSPTTSNTTTTFDTPPPPLNPPPTVGNTTPGVGNPAPTPPPPAPVSFTLTGCEADPVTLTCSQGAIKSATIKYGRWNNTVCPHVTINASTTPTWKTYTLRSALGKTSHRVVDAKNFDPDVNEDPYPGVYKHWEIQYTCS